MKVLVAILVMLALAGCGVRENTPFARVEFVPQPDGTVFAEVWVEAPATEGCKLEGDTSQDVVALVYPNGRMALPDRVEGTDLPQTQLQQDPTGFVPVGVYHLTNPDTGQEIDYYKRKAARTANRQ